MLNLYLFNYFFGIDMMKVKIKNMVIVVVLCLVVFIGVV